MRLELTRVGLLAELRRYDSAESSLVLIVLNMILHAYVYV